MLLPTPELEPTSVCLQIIDSLELMAVFKFSIQKVQLLQLWSKVGSERERNIARRLFQCLTLQFFVLFIHYTVMRTQTGNESTTSTRAPQRSPQESSIFEWCYSL